MKAYQYISIAAVTIGLAACHYDVNPESLYLSEQQVADEVADGTLYTLNDFLDAYMTEEGNYLSDTSLYRTRSTNGDGTYLFSIDTLPSTGKGIYVRGRVTTDDYGGNFYKALVIQQIVNGEQQNLRLSVDLGSVSGMFPRGQEVLIKCNGLAIGRYANQPQLCVPSYNNNTNAQNYEQKVGWAPGRIPAPICRTHFKRIGLPDASKLQYDTLTIAQCIANYSDIKAARKVDGKLVVVNNIWFDGLYNDTKGRDTCHHYKNTAYKADHPDEAESYGVPKQDGNSAVFGPTTGNIGYPQGRCITDGKDWTLVSTSEYAKYAYFYLPYELVSNAAGNDAIVYGTYKGSVRGILGYYMDNAGYSPDQSKWSITICDLSDLNLHSDGSLASKGGKEAGAEWTPEEWVE